MAETVTEPNRRELTDKMVKSQAPDPHKILTIHDGHEKAAGLQLRVFPSGQKRWVVRYRNANGRQRIHTIGAYPTVPLTIAREKARAAMLQVLNREDPFEEKKKRREAEQERLAADTVGEFAAIFIRRYALGPGVKVSLDDITNVLDRKVKKLVLRPGDRPNKRSWRNDVRTLKADVLPNWKRRLMREITRRDARELLQTILDRGKDIHANRVFALLSTMWAYALDQEVIEHNVIRDMKRPTKKEKPRSRALTPEEIRLFWTFTETMPKVQRAAWRLMLYAGQRPQEETAQAQWGEFDLEAAWWVIPGTKTKNGRTHRVPLSEPIATLLREIRPADPKPDDFVFAGYSRHPDIRTGSRFPAPLHLPGDDAQKHFKPKDLRTTMRTMLEGDGIPERWAEEVQNHKPTGVKKHYNLHEYDREKRQAVDHWARRVDAIVNETEGAAILLFAARA